MYFANHAVYRNSKSFSKTLMTAFHVTEFCKDDFYSFSLKASKQNKDVSNSRQEAVRKKQQHLVKETTSSLSKPRKVPSDITDKHDHSRSVTLSRVVLLCQL